MFAISPAIHRRERVSKKHPVSSWTFDYNPGSNPSTDKALSRYRTSREHGNFKDLFTRCVEFCKQVSFRRRNE